jgi:hypothetical protein
MLQNVGLILAWIQANPQSFKMYFGSFLILLVKAILQFAGLSDKLAQYNDAIATTSDLLIGVAFAWTFISGLVHGHVDRH